MFYYLTISNKYMYIDFLNLKQFFFNSHNTNAIRFICQTSCRREQKSINLKNNRKAQI